MGRAVVTADGLVIVLDRVDLVRQLFEVLAKVEQVESATWAIQLHVVRLTDDVLADLGLDVTPAVELGAAAVFSSGMDVTSSLNSLASVKAVLRAAATDRRASILADPFFLLTDGEKVDFRQGGEIAFRNQVLTPGAGGPLQTQVVERMTVGSSYEIVCRELSDDRARLRLRIERAKLDGFRDGVPQRMVDSSNHVVDLVTGGTYLIAHYVEGETEDLTGTWLRWGTTKRRTTTSVQVWVSAYRVAVGGGGAMVETFAAPLPVVPDRDTVGDEQPSHLVPMPAVRGSIPIPSAF